ncbi:hypothetical protein LTR20_006765 [Exophiala xenobiotica]|nr:hypothetical protein LTS06_011661 [Exophiala xenobiotica]KAK5279754.1 hypothetical protein LTR40_007335 [Exophiala xenobiotica]KAK5371366.1 hypothetical protein LTS13_006743 [Exophiala xenobiotica]KAK5394791.1 hypothetical protein LTR79_007407 [Exophiala xenobiotica]KAK5413207.1 hypothetical protein LTR90_007329 [Exophiala xenobiotica]
MISHPETGVVNLEHNRRHFGARLVFIVIFICFGSGSYGFSNAVIGSTLGQPSFLAAMGLDSSANAEALVSVVLAIFYVGGFFGGICHALLADRYGRKVSAAVAATIMIVASAVCTGSNSMGLYIAFRFFNGWSSYQFLCTIPTWVTEITPPSHCGVLGNIIAVNIGVGYVLAAFIGIGFYFVSGNSQWRGITGLQMLFPGALLGAIYWLPESPRYLIAKDRHEEALTILKLLHSSAAQADHFAEMEYYQIRKQIEWDNAHRMTYLEIFKHPTMKKRAWITICMTWCMVGSGVLVINNYGTAIYPALGYNELDTLFFLAGWVGIVALAPLLCMTFVDKVSRTYLIASGFFLCMCTLIVEAALQANYLGTDNAAGLAGGVAMTYLYVFFYVICMDGPMFFNIGEIWPSHVRVQGFAIGICSMCICNIVWTAAAPTAFANIGWKYYIFFIVQAAIGGVATLLYFPNTLKKPLEEIAALFGDADEVVVFQGDLDQSRFDNGIHVKDSDEKDERVEIVEGEENKGQVAP